MFEVKETSPAGDLKYGNTTVGTSAVQVSPNSVELVRGLLLRSPGAADSVPNTDIIYIGLASVTADSSATGGMPLVPGGILELPVDDPSLIYAISGTPGQNLNWLGI
jgi:hypothetical protein